MSDIEDAMAYYYDHPVEYAIDICNFEPTDQQREVLSALPQAIKDKKGVAVKSGHGTGKTGMEAACIKWFMDTRPFARIVATAPTQHQLHDVTWPELAKWNRSSLTKDTCEWQKTHFINNKYPERWFAVAVTSNQPDNMQGFHEEHLLFVVEEASGIKNETMEVIEGTQTQEGCLVIMFGNPTQISGAFYDAFHSKREFYKTFTLNAEESPLVDQRNCEKIAKKYGKDSDVYRVRVLGQFPKAQPDTLIGLDKVEAAVEREMVRPPVGEYNTVEIGVDVARFGDDESTIYSRVADTIELEDVLHKRDLMYLVGRVVQVIRKFPGKQIIVNIDDTGVGGGVTDRLNELIKEGELPGVTVFGVNNGSSADDKLKYVNKSTEMWFFMREYIKKVKLPNDTDLIGQLSTRKYTLNSSGKTQIESKKEMKKRGLTSPDRADGAILTIRSLISVTDQAGQDSWAYAA